MSRRHPRSSGLARLNFTNRHDAHLESLSGEAAESGQASPKEMAAELDSLRKRLRKAANRMRR